MSGTEQPRVRARPVPRHAPPVLSGAGFAAALRPLLTPWLGSAGFSDWQRRVAELPLANRLFLELHPGQKARRCDIVSSITVSDGSLAAWANRDNAPPQAVWRPSSAFLREWQRQLRAGQGALWADCLMMWFEFDLLPEALGLGAAGLGAPSLFIALGPGASLQRLAAAAADFPDLQAAIARFATWRAEADPAFRQEALLLGHIGYMAARGDSGQVLPLRSCWRCDDLAHLRHLLQAAALPIEMARLDREFARLGALFTLGNSLMLDLDSDRQVQADFAVEINLFQRQEGAGAARMQAALHRLSALGYVTPEEAAAAGALSGHALAKTGDWMFCLPHHVKIRFSGGRAAGVKLYWLARVMDHPPQRPERECSASAQLLLTRNECRH